MEILEPGPCPTCGLDGTPADGKWRYARSGKRYESLSRAEHHAASLNRNKISKVTHEFVGVLDQEGHGRIASRRRVA